MRWTLPWPKLAAGGIGGPADDGQLDGWQRHVGASRQSPSRWQRSTHSVPAQSEPAGHSAESQLAVQ